MRNWCRRSPHWNCCTFYSWASRVGSFLMDLFIIGRGRCKIRNLGIGYLRFLIKGSLCINSPPVLRIYYSLRCKLSTFGSRRPNISRRDIALRTTLLKELRGRSIKCRISICYSSNTLRSSSWMGNLSNYCLRISFEWGTARDSSSVIG